MFQKTCDILKYRILNIVPFGKVKDCTEIDLYSALYHIIGYERLKELVGRNLDPREFIDCALNSTVDFNSKLYKKLASKLRLPLILQLPKFDLRHAENFNIKELQRLGIIPLYHGEMCAGFVVANPSFALKYCPGLKQYELHLASYKLISKALLEIEEDVSQHEIIKEANEKQLLENQALEVLQNVTAEAQKYLAQAFDIRILDNELVYEFRLPDGRRAKGNISHKLKKALLLKLESIANGGVKINFNVEILSPGEAFRISTKEEFVAKSIALIPTEIPDNNVIPFKASSKSDLPTETYKLLIVEDNQTFNQVLECYLSKQGFQVEFASNGNVALNHFAKFKPDAIICDLHLPGMTGFEFVQKLRSLEDGQHIPIIILTSDDHIDTELEVLEYGADAFLSKTQDPRLLVSYAKRLISTQRNIFKVQVA